MNELFSPYCVLFQRLAQSFSARRYRLIEANDFEGRVHVYRNVFFLYLYPVRARDESELSGSEVNFNKALYVFLPKSHSFHLLKTVVDFLPLL